MQPNRAYFPWSQHHFRQTFLHFASTSSRQRFSSSIKEPRLGTKSTIYHPSCCFSYPPPPRPSSSFYTVHTGSSSTALPAPTSQFGLWSLTSGALDRSSASKLSTIERWRWLLPIYWRWRIKTSVPTTIDSSIGRDNSGRTRGRKHRPVGSLSTDYQREQCTRLTEQPSAR